VLEIPREKKIVVYVGEISPGRGLEHMIEALQWLEDVVLVIIGEGARTEYERTLLQRADSLKVSHKICRMKYHPFNTMIRYVASADLGIVYIQNLNLSYLYSLPNKLFEYLLAGIPIIASDMPEIRKIVDEYQVGCIVELADSRRLGEKIKHVLSDPDLAAQFRSNARRAIRENNWQLESKKLVALYEELRVKSSQARNRLPTPLPESSSRIRCGSLLLVCLNSSPAEVLANIEKDVTWDTVTTITRSRYGLIDGARTIYVNGLLGLFSKGVLREVTGDGNDTAIFIYKKRYKADFLTTLIAGMCRAKRRLATTNDRKSGYDMFDATFWSRLFRSHRLPAIKGYMKILARGVVSPGNRSPMPSS